MLRNMRRLSTPAQAYAEATKLDISASFLTKVQWDQCSLKLQHFFHFEEFGSNIYGIYKEGKESFDFGIV